MSQNTEKKPQVDLTTAQKLAQILDNMKNMASDDLAKPAPDKPAPVTHNHTFVA